MKHDAIGKLDDPALWANLLSSQHRGVEERRDIERLLGLWGRTHGAIAAALYGPDGHRLIACIGDAPSRQPLEDASEELRKLVLPSGHVLLHNAKSPVENASSTEGLLLACAASILQLKDKLDENKLFALSQGVELMALYEVGLAIASILDLEQLMEELLSRALMLVDASRGALYQLQGDKYVLTLARGAAAQELDPEQVDVRAGEASSTDLLPGARHVLAVPIGSAGNRKGLLMVGSDEEEREGAPFPAKDRRTLTLFANQAAIALEKARLHKLAIEKERQDREIELAAEIQQQLLPDEMPQIRSFDVLGWNRPARVVGGDYFTFRDLGEDVWALLIGDVSGKGSPAALLVSTIDAALRVLLDQNRLDVELVQDLNRYVYDASTGNKYVTMVLASLDVAAGRLDYINAGHNEGLLIRGDGRLEHLESSGPPVGLLPIWSARSPVSRSVRGTSCAFIATASRNARTSKRKNLAWDGWSICCVSIENNLSTA